MSLGKIKVIIFAIIAVPVAIALIFMLQAGFLFIIMGLLPTVVAYFVDGYPGKPTFKCVASCNIAGMVPTLADVTKSDSMAASMQILMGDLYTWFLVFGAAACGYGLLIFSRVLTQIGMTITDQARVEALLKKQNELTEEWGEKVKTNQVQAIS